MSKIEEKVENLICKTIEDLGYELYDVIYEKEAKDYYLRVFIDNQVGISLEDCEKVNDAINDILDEANYIKDQYFLEISSPGVERLLRKDKHLEAALNKEIALNLFTPITLEEDIKQENNGNKTPKSKNKNNNDKKIDGVLINFDEEKITIYIQNLQKNIEIPRKNIATMNLKFNWN